MKEPVPAGINKEEEKKTSQGWKPYGRDLRLGAEHDSPARRETPKRKKVAPGRTENDLRKEERRMRAINHREQGGKPQILGPNRRQSHHRKSIANPRCRRDAPS